MARGKYKQWLTKEGLILIEGWARDGLTDVQIAKKIGISKQTFYDWQKRYPDFSDSLKKGKEIVDRQVENALLKKALGYSYKECTEITDAEGNVSTKIITKYVIPDTTANTTVVAIRLKNGWIFSLTVQSTRTATPRTSPRITIKFVSIIFSSCYGNVGFLFLFN